MRGEERKRKIRRRRIAVAATALSLFLVFLLLGYFLSPAALLPAYRFSARGEGEMRVRFLDVGEGDCAVLEFPDGEVLVVDGGDGSLRHRNKLIRTLKGLEIASLSVLITHADLDHFGGISAILEGFDVKKAYLPCIGSEGFAYQNLLKAIEKEGCETEICKRYDVFETKSGGYAVCLSPYSAGETDENEASTVLYVSYGGVNFLFGADITAARERRLLAEYSTDFTIFDSGTYTVRLDDVDILKVSHHGSAYSSSSDWLNLLGAETAILSCGRGNSYAHPAAETVERLKAACSEAEIYRTDELGDIVISVKDGTYTVGFEG